MKYAAQYPLPYRLVRIIEEAELNGVRVPFDALTDLYLQSGGEGLWHVGLTTCPCGTSLPDFEAILNGKTLAQLTELEQAVAVDCLKRLEELVGLNLQRENDPKTRELALYAWNRRDQLKANYNLK